MNNDRLYIDPKSGKVRKLLSEKEASSEHLALTCRNALVAIREAAKTGSQYKWNVTALREFIAIQESLKVFESVKGAP